MAAKTIPSLGLVARLICQNSVQESALGSLPLSHHLFSAGSATLPNALRDLHMYIFQLLLLSPGLPASTYQLKSSFRKQTLSHFFVSHKPTLLGTYTFVEKTYLLGHSGKHALYTKSCT